MKKSTAVLLGIGLVTIVFLFQQPGQTTVQSFAVTSTKDAATQIVTGDQTNDPGVGIVVATQSSRNLAFSAKRLIGCDQSAYKEITSAGGFGLAGTNGQRIYVCSYSISNGNTARDVQFVAGVEASSGGGGSVCNPGDVITAKFHLAPNQFISQGSGLGSLFSAPQGVCLKVTGASAGDVSVNITYAHF